MLGYYGASGSVRSEMVDSGVVRRKCPPPTVSILSSTRNYHFSSIMFRLFAVVLALASASAFVAPGHVASVSVRGSAVTMGAKKVRP